MPDNIVYLNGEYLPIESACVPVMDRGFLFGDGVYEVIPVFGRKLLRIEEHLHRLDNSMARVSLPSLYSHDEWLVLFDELLERNPGEQRALYLQVTRGVHPKRDIKIVQGHAPTVFAMVLQIDPVSLGSLESGISAITVEDFRWHACDIKSISLIANVMMKQQATEVGASDAILLRNGYVTEGTASNLFIVRAGVLITPPNSELLLPGITRDLVLDIARQHGIPCEERDIRAEELAEAEEIWLTSSMREIAPVVELDGRQVGDGSVGPLWRKLVTLYQETKRQLQSS